MRAPMLSWTELRRGAIQEEASSDRLREFLVSLPAPRSRIHFSEAMAAADQFLRKSWQDAGWATAAYPFRIEEADGIQDFDEFPRVTYHGLEGVNLVAVKEGSASGAIVIGAHLDTVRDSPGACDNGAVIAALAEIARLLAPLELKKTVILAAFDMEEIGILGSPELIPVLTSRYSIEGAIVLESVGFVDHAPRSQSIPFGFGLLFPRQTGKIRLRRRRGDWTAVIYRRSAQPIVDALNREAGAMAGARALVSLRDPLDRRVVGPLLRQLVPSLGNLARSDHAAFWRAGIPAVQLTDTANFRGPHYHQATDTAETLDFEHLRRITAAVASAAAILAGPDESA
jgi:hypothetical protein